MFAPLFSVPKDVRRMSAAANVSVLTTLMPFSPIGQYASALLFALINLSDDVPVTFIVETSEDGLHPDGERRYELPAAPGEQASLEAGPVQLRRFWRIAAHTEGPAYPAAQVKWVVRGVPR